MYSEIGYINGRGLDHEISRERNQVTGKVSNGIFNLDQHREGASNNHWMLRIGQIIID